MINRNVPVVKIGQRKFAFESSIEESGQIQKMLDKYGCMLLVNVNKPISPGTDAQNRAMHALLTEYYKTGLHSAPEGTTLSQFKNYIKCLYGISHEIIIGGEKYRIIKSWSDYTKYERAELMNGLISEIKQSGAMAESLEIQKILAGMEI